MSLIKKRLCVLMATLLVLVPGFVLATTYVFPYEGFRYTQQGNETVLTQTNLQDHAEFLGQLGTGVDTMLANYSSNGIVMEVFPEHGGQITVSVSENPYLKDQRMFDELSIEEKEELLKHFVESGLYESCELSDSTPGTIRVTSSAMLASMPVYSVSYMTMSYGKLYTLTLSVVGRQVESSDDEAIRKVFSGMQMFEARKQKAGETDSETPVPELLSEPQNTYAEVQKVEGVFTLDPISTVVYEDTVILTGKTEADITLTVTCGEETIGQTNANSDGDFSVRVHLPELGENHLSIDAEKVHAELTLSYALPLATVRILEPTELIFTGESVLIRGETVPDAIVYFTGDNIGTNAIANRYGIFSLRIQVLKAGKMELTIRSHHSGYSDYTTTLQLERILTEREKIAAFKQNVLNIDYSTLCTQPKDFTDKSFVFRGRVMEYVDYNGNPCALICVSNPSTGIWRDPLYAVIDAEDVPEVGEVMTFYLVGEGITLPAAGIYTQSGTEEEVPVTQTFYITTNR